MNVAIPALADDLQATASQVGWLPTLYMLGSVAFMLPVGKLADMYGRKRMYALGLLVNAVAALFCGLSNDINHVLVWRFVQGVAGAMIFGTGIAIVTSVTSAKKRGKALGLVASCVYVGLTAAPAAGGYLTDAFGWRAVFYFQIPFVLVLLAFMLVKLKGEWKSEQQTTFDWSGSALFVLFAASLVYGLANLPHATGIACLVGAVGLLSLFVMHQQRQQQPLIRTKLFSENRMFSLSLATAFFMYASNFAIVFLLSLYLQYVKGFSPSQAGNVLLVQALCMAVIAPFAGHLADRFQSRIVATAGCIAVLCGFIGLNFIDVTSTTVFIILTLALVGTGFGLFSTPNNSAIMGAVDAREMGVASASMNLARTIGNLFGISLINLLLQLDLGDTALSAKYSAEIMHTISVALTISLVMVVIATLLSMSRGSHQ